MKILDLTQGSQEWHDARAHSYNASEAAAMMGSGYMKRTELLNLKKNMNQKEASSFLKMLFEKGHRAEESARPFAEELIEEDLYPIVGSIEIDGLTLLASFDGLTMMHDIGFENKLMNKDLVEMIETKNLSAKYYWQLEQQLLVSEAEYVVFTVSDGTKEGTLFLKYYSVPERRETLIAGWKQFDLDVKDHVEKPAYIKPTAKPIMHLPALTVIVKGSIQQSNLSIYEGSLKEFLDNQNRDPVSDQDFVDAETSVKFCAKIEDELKNAKKQALSQTSDIEHFYRIVDNMIEMTVELRLDLNKKVKYEKDNRKTIILNESRQKLLAFYQDLYTGLPGIRMPELPDTFPIVMKGKRNRDSMQDAVDTELANIKILANKTASIIRSNLDILNDFGDEYTHLFSDLNDIITTQSEVFALIVRERIADYDQAKGEELQAAIDKKLDEERETIRKEEEAKAQAKVRAEAQEEAKIKAQAEVLHQASVKVIENRQDDDIIPEQYITEPGYHEAKEEYHDTLDEAVAHYRVDNNTEVQPGPNGSGGMMCIPFNDYLDIVEQSTMMQAFIEAGVEEWEGYNQAMALFTEEMKCSDYPTPNCT